jgi:hypothetical protein
MEREALEKETGTVQAWGKGTSYVSKTLSKKTNSPMHIFYHGVYLIFLSDLLLPLY